MGEPRPPVIGWTLRGHWGGRGGLRRSSRTAAVRPAWANRALRWSAGRSGVIGVVGEGCVGAPGPGGNRVWTGP